MDIKFKIHLNVNLNIKRTCINTNDKELSITYNNDIAKPAWNEIHITHIINAYDINIHFEDLFPSNLRTNNKDDKI